MKSYLYYRWWPSTAQWARIVRDCRARADAAGRRVVDVEAVAREMGVAVSRRHRHTAVTTETRYDPVLHQRDDGTRFVARTGRSSVVERCTCGAVRRSTKLANGQTVVDEDWHKEEI